MHVSPCILLSGLVLSLAETTAGANPNSAHLRVTRDESSEATWQPMAGPCHAGLLASWLRWYSRGAEELSNPGAASKTAVRHMLRECFCENMCRCAIILRTQAVSKPMHVASSPESPRLLAWLLLERRRSPEGLGDLVERHGSKWILEAIIWGGSHNASTGKKDAAQRQNRRGCSSKSPLCHESWSPLSRAVASILSISLQTKRRGHGGMHGHGDGCLAIHKLFRGAFVQ